MDIRKIKKLIDLIEASNIGELEIRQGEESIRICKTTHQATAIAAVPIARPVPAAETPPPKDPAAGLLNGRIVKSPMVGTFYRASSPSSKPYVEVGDRVEPGQVLCIIEAMKLMNQLEADAAGVVRAVLVETGQPIEFGQPLFVID